MFSRLQCVFIICMMAGRRAGPGFFSGLGNGSILRSLLPPVFLPFLPKGGKIVEPGGKQEAPHLVLFGVHAFFFVLFCCRAVFGFCGISLFCFWGFGVKRVDACCLLGWSMSTAGEESLEGGAGGAMLRWRRPLVDGGGV